MTYRLKGSYSVGARGGVVHGDAAVGVADNVVDHLGNPLKAAVPCAEVHVGGPVVGQVLVEGARSAARQLRDVFHGHRSIEGVLWPLARSITAGWGQMSKALLLRRFGERGPTECCRVRRDYRMSVDHPFPYVVKAEKYGSMRSMTI
jgi:hypothetical protein